MSELQKRIGRVLRRESPRSIGFGAVSRDAPRAMLLVAAARDLTSAKGALDAGADVLLLASADAAAAAAVLKGLPEKTCAGALLTAFDEAGSGVLHDAGCDFVVSALESTASTAVDPERMGQVVAIADGVDDTTLRSLGPIGIDALYVERQPGPMTLAGQLALVRLSSFASCPLMVTVDRNTTSPELRVLRDSGAAAVVAPAGSSAEELKALSDALKAIPAARKSSRDIALVPAVGAGHEEHEHEEEDE